jgi:hypothetical protein
MPEIREHPPPKPKTLMAGPLGGDTRDLGAFTTYIEDIDGGPLGGDGRDLVAPTTYVEDIGGGATGRRC